MLGHDHNTLERGQRARANKQIDFDMQAEYAKSRTPVNLVAEVLASGKAGGAPGRASPELLEVNRPLYDVLSAIDKIVAQNDGAGVN